MVPISQHFKVFHSLSFPYFSQEKVDKSKIGKAEFFCLMHVIFRKCNHWYEHHNGHARNWTPFSGIGDCWGCFRFLIYLCLIRGLKNPSICSTCASEKCDELTILLTSFARPYLQSILYLPGNAKRLRTIGGSVNSHRETIVLFPDTDFSPTTARLKADS